MLGTDQEQAEGEQTLLRSKLSIGSVAPEKATTYAFLDIEQNEGKVQRIALKKRTVLIGRIDPRGSTTPEIDLTTFDHSRSVSRQHARILIEKNLFFIEDLGSRNKTKLGEVTISPHKPTELQNGAMVRFGSVKATFRLLGTSALPDPWSQS